MFRTVALASVVAVCSVALAGPLDPPAGPVAPTMKPLDTIEPRRCLNDLLPDEGAVVLVTEPGQYFMSADIVAGPGQHGVRIVAEGRVSIDLNGFSIRGAEGTQNGIDMALAPQASPSSLHVLGAEGAGRSSISGFGGDGVFTAYVADVRCENFDTTDHLGNGLHHLHAENVIHRDIAARNCGSNGVRSACRLTGIRQHKAINVVSTGNGGDGISIEPTDGAINVTLENVVCKENLGHGVHIVEPLVSGRDGGSETVVVKVMYAELGLNGGSGGLYELPVGSKSSVSVSDSTSNENTGDGFAVRVYGPGDAHFGSITVHSRVDYSGNGGHGLVSDNPIFMADSTCSDNVLYGVSGSTGDATTLAMTVERSVIQANTAGGARCGPGRFAVSELRVSDNGGHGLELADGCLVVSNSTVTNNALDGIAVTNGTLNVKSSAIRRNGERGIDCGGTAGAGISPIVVLEDVVCELNGALITGGGGANFDGCQSVTLRRCSFNNNTGYGVRCRSSIGPVRWMAPEMLLQGNSGNGADLDNITGGTLDRCYSSGNGGVGILIGQSCTKVRVTGCSSTDDGIGGIWVLGTGNLIVGCSATSTATGAFDIAPNNSAGVVISGGELPQVRDCNANVVW